MTTLQISSFIGLIIYFIILIVTVVKKRKSDNVIDYFFAGRTLPFWVLSITFIASWWGAGSAISTADLAYKDGLGAFWYYGVPVLLSTFLMILGSKAIRRVDYLTQGSMMEARYSKGVAKILSIMVLIFMTFTAASQMVGIGNFFGTYLGMSYSVAVIVGTGIVLIYSLFGGFRGVVLTDIIQFIFLSASAIAVFVVAIINAGGFDEISKAAMAVGKDDYMNITSGIPKYMTYVITFGCAWMIQANVWQRISATKNDGDARKMTTMSFFAYIPLYLIVVFTGMAGLVLFKEMPEGGIIAAIVINYMSPFLGAIVFVGISAAIMSTMDSLINTGAMTLTMDLTNIEDKNKKLNFSKLATFLVTFVALIISLQIPSILDIAWMASDIITTGVFVPLVLGFIWRDGTSKGAMSSMVFGLLYCSYNLLRTFGVDLPAFWELQSTLQAIIGVSISFIVYVTISLMSKKEYEKADKFIKKASIFKK